MFSFDISLSAVALEYKVHNRLTVADVGRDERLLRKGNALRESITKSGRSFRAHLWNGLMDGPDGVR